MSSASPRPPFPANPGQVLALALLALVVLAGLVFGSVALLTWLRPFEDTNPLLALLAGLTVPTVLSLLAYLRAAQNGEQIAQHGAKLDALQHAAEVLVNTLTTMGSTAGTREGHAEGFVQGLALGTQAVARREGGQGAGKG